MFRVILLSGILLLSGIFATGCNTVKPTVESAKPATKIEEVVPDFERQQICFAVEQFALHTSRQINIRNEILGASNLKAEYKVEACKKILFVDEGYGIVSLHIYEGDKKLPNVETELMVALVPHEGRWVIVQVTELYTSPDPEQTEELDTDDSLSVKNEEDKKEVVVDE